MLNALKLLLLFGLTAVAEIVGCYLPWLWLRKEGPWWLLLPAGLSLMLFVWLLTLHPAAAGRVYAAYGGVYVAVALLWLWLVDGVRPSGWDIAGAAVALCGMAIIMLAPRPG
ncbi:MULTISPECIES: YnfA family protein [Chromobacterium]|uniref:YnfA family protein n=2 Tax=Chromobacterium TaxID=535 RepID=A0ABS3GLB9_9NEIS|nr:MULTISPECIES: YnfA family protein [Chromobacterium]AXT45479.1 YnfA family protein [Chromobacterium rhizoryzae]MBK0414554.1 YnfA family protein [Chromobacterium haemolyticum]MBO0415812.1 YnfA family protein [Chromobacterium haemolyticum]MBO0499072.1 YnfA family protein [Chromobacterium haemolyticum]MDH0341760.1 YnfA family protein [Chromobacterium haemolyticum]